MYYFNKEQLKNHQFLPYIIMTIPMVIGGTTWPLGKWLVSSYYGTTIPQLIIVLARYIVALPILFLILYIKEGSIHFQFMVAHKKYLSILGILIVTIYQIGYMFGETYTTGTEASLLIATVPIAVFIISTVFVGYKITPKHLLGLIIGFLGVFLVITFETPSSVTASNPNLGNSLIIMAVIAFAIYTVVLKHFMNSFESSESKPSSLAILTWLSTFGILFIIPLAFVISPNYLSIQSFIEIPPRIWFGIFYLGILPTVFGFMLYIEGIKMLDPNRAVIFSNIIPIVGIGLSALLLGEKIDLIIHVGALILIFISIYLVNKQQSLS